MSTLAGSLLTLVTACSNEAMLHPTTREEFVAAYKKAYESGNVSAIEQWVMWGDCPEELRPQLLDFATMFAGKNKVVSIKCEDYDPRFVKSWVEKGEHLHFTLKPILWFSVETFGHAGFEGGESRLQGQGALGCKDGELYFCGPYMDFSGWRKKHPVSPSTEPKRPQEEAENTTNDNDLKR